MLYLPAHGRDAQTRIAFDMLRLARLALPYGPVSDPRTWLLVAALLGVRAEPSSAPGVGPGRLLYSAWLDLWVIQYRDSGGDGIGGPDHRQGGVTPETAVAR